MKQYLDTQPSETHTHYRCISTLMWYPCMWYADRSLHGTLQRDTAVSAPSSMAFFQAV